jgi:hypothetical protein
MKRYAAAGILLLMITLAPDVPAFAVGRMANSGTVLRLAATDAPEHGDFVTVSSRVRADSRVNNSNLYYEIVAPDGSTVVATHSTSMPRMRAGDTYDDVWSTSNDTFPDIGTYSVTLCWSPGNSHNCTIAGARTTFYSVPALGWGLTMVGVILLVAFLWGRRDQFDRAASVVERGSQYDH